MPYFISKSNIKINYILEGKGKNLILFLHCWGGNHRFWKNQIAEFASDFTCVAIDFPGHGNSGESKEYGPKPFSKIVAEFVTRDIFKGRKIIVVGHSLGGMTALRFVIENPDKAKALILIDTSAHLTGYLGHNIAVPLITSTIPLYNDLVKRIGIYITAFFPTSSSEAKKFVANEVLKVPNKTLKKVLQGIHKFNVLDKLNEIDVPTQIIVGLGDIYTDIRQAFDLKRKIRNSRLKAILHTGHMSPLERPTEVNSIIRRFLEEIKI